MALIHWFIKRTGVAGYILSLLVLSYLLTIQLSSFYYRVDAGALNYVFSWPRVVGCGLGVLILFFVILHFNKHKTTKDNIGNPISLHALSVSTFVVSVGASVFSSQILSSMRTWFYRGNDIPIASLSDLENTLLIEPTDLMLLFIAGVLTLLYLFIDHGKQAHRLKSTLEVENKEASKELRDAIRVAPPPYFTRMLADISDQSEDFLSEVTIGYAKLEAIAQNSDIDIDERIKKAHALIDDQRNTLRAVLAGFGRLAATYDSVNPLDKTNTVEYRANLMLLVEQGSEVLDVVFPEKKPNVRFKARFNSDPAYYLIIDKRLSIKIGKQFKEIYVATDAEEGSTEIIKANTFNADSNVKNALLPVYWEDGQDDLHNYNMIGAPMAVVEGRPKFIPDTVRSIEGVKNLYNDTLYREALSYFEGDKKGKSIVSFPVATRHFKTKSSPSPKLNSLYGTINLYRNEENIFSGDKKNFEFFSDFTRPLQLIIGRMCYFHIATCFQASQLQQQKAKASD